MSDTIIVALIGFAGTIIGAIIGTRKDGDRSRKVPDSGSKKQAITTSLAGLAIGILVSIGVIWVINNNVSVSEMAGTWIGTEGYSDRSYQIEITIYEDCSTGSKCGKVSYPGSACFGNLLLDRKTGQTFIFLEQITSSCSDASGGYNHLRLLDNDTLAINYIFPDGEEGAKGILVRK
ncbi:MAG: hypothetical protein HN921_11305 [Bacteroidetes bacterium]|jgi:hypothetical protein|nr:hypothetical protein [Bacteroidota bacterium]